MALKLIKWFYLQELWREKSQFENLAGVWNIQIKVKICFSSFCLHYCSVCSIFKLWPTFLCFALGPAVHRALHYCSVLCVSEMNVI